jgi:hypothetical protein
VSGAARHPSNGGYRIPKEKSFSFALPARVPSLETHVEIYLKIPEGFNTQEISSKENPYSLFLDDAAPPRHLKIGIFLLGKDISRQIQQKVE